MAVERPVFTPPDWYRGESDTQIQARMMSRLPPDIDNIQGGFPYDFTMPTAMEIDELMNFYLLQTLQIMFPAWSFERYLDYHAASNGITRRAPNHASGTLKITGVPGTQIPAGTIFCVPAVGDTPAIEYATDDIAVIGPAEEPEDAPVYGVTEVGITAVDGGTGGNVAANTIVIMASPVTGVVTVTNPEAITGGTAEESDDDLYERIAMAEQSAGDSFVGNDADYIRWAKEVSGVGTVLVDTQYEVDHPNWVRLIILDTNGEPANRSILDAVYQHIMCPDNRPAERLAPVGAVLVVEAPAGCELRIHITGLEIEDGSSKEGIIRRFKEALEEYYVEAKAEREIKWNRVHAIFTNTEGVVDFSSLTVNGNTDNIELGADDYPMTKEVTADE